MGKSSGSWIRERMRRAATAVPMVARWDFNELVSIAANQLVSEFAETLTG
ncbi:MAG: hypothetical protein GY803_23060 [Chloroflexi bacterium]|nr:hypothetical protein [Chloroflexota bacterium]